MNILQLWPFLNLVRYKISPAPVYMTLETGSRLSSQFRNFPPLLFRSPKSNCHASRHDSPEAFPCNNVHQIEKLVFFWKPEDQVTHRTMYIHVCFFFLLSPPPPPLPSPPPTHKRTLAQVTRRTIYINVLFFSAEDQISNTLSVSRSSLISDWTLGGVVLAGGWMP